MNFDFLLNALAAVESGYDDAKIGHHGERSCYQIKESVWRQHRGADEPFSLCRSFNGKACARTHLQWLDKNISEPNPTARILYLVEAWSIGLNAYRKGKINFDVVSKANRVLNLYNEKLNASTKLVPQS